MSAIHKSVCHENIFSNDIIETNQYHNFWNFFWGVGSIEVTKAKPSQLDSPLQLQSN
jgi:hypothetical protein